MKNQLWIAVTLIFACATSSWAQAPKKLTSNSFRADVQPASAASASVGTAAVKVPMSSAFIIGKGDVLAVNVWKDAEVSRVVPVRPDGRISVPLIGELQASGQTVKQLEAEIRTKLKDYVSEPEVTVIVQEIKSQKFNVLGMVMRPGSYTLTKPMSVIDAIALAGGFRDFAKQKDIYVLRPVPDGTPKRLPFNYKDVVKGRNSAQNIELESNDTIVVP